jgi:hypothetical protein
MKNISLQSILPSAISLAVCLVSLSLAGCAEERKAPEDVTWEDVQKEWEDLQENGRDAGKALGEGFFELGRGIQDGLEKALENDNISPRALRIEPSAADLGFRVNRISKMLNTLELYTVFDRPFSGRLRIKALDSAGLEIGRATVQVEQAADSATHLRFGFESRTQLGAAVSYVLSRM